MKPETLTVAAKVENLPRVLDSLDQAAEAAGMAVGRRTRMMIALEEAFVNICRYAYSAGEGVVRLHWGAEAGGFVVEVIDWGKPFDLLSLPEPNLDTGLAERKIGGLGVFCMRNLADQVSCRRQDNRNILRLVFAMG